MRRARDERARGAYRTSPLMNYAHRSAHCNVVKGPPIGTRDRSKRWQNNKRFDRVISRWWWRFALVLLWKCGFRTNGTRRMYKTIDPEEPNGRAFRDREFFTRIIRLRQDPPIRYGEGRILFSSLGKTLRISFVRRQTRGVQDFRDLHLKLLVCFPLCVSAETLRRRRVG